MARTTQRGLRAHHGTCGSPLSILQVLRGAAPCAVHGLSCGMSASEGAMRRFVWAVAPRAHHSYLPDRTPAPSRRPDRPSARLALLRVPHAPTLSIPAPSAGALVTVCRPHRVRARSHQPPGRCLAPCVFHPGRVAVRAGEDPGERGAKPSADGHWTMHWFIGAL